MIACVFLTMIYYEYSLIRKEKPMQEIVTQLRAQENFLEVDEISEHFIKAIVATEDRRFYNRSGFDIRAFLRAITTNIKEGELVQGGSTIPQQVGKLLYFDHIQTLKEKVIQVYIMYDLESLYSKDEILELYVNSIYFGSGYTGIKKASEGYFHTSAHDLSPAQGSLLAGVVAAPSAYDPSVNFDLAKQRQMAVLISLRDVYNYTQAQIDEIYQTEVVIY